MAANAASQGNNSQQKDTTQTKRTGKALVIFESWDTEKYGLTEFHRNLFKDICSRQKGALEGCATVLDITVSEAQIEDAGEAGITLIPGKRIEYLDEKDDPINIRWLYHHRSYYTDLQKLDNVKFVIGYAPFTADAAAYIRKTLFPDAKLYQINALHPDLRANVPTRYQSKLEDNMLRMAAEADAMVSIGPSMYDFFENAYRAPEKIIPHLLLLPKTGERYNKQCVKEQNDIRQLVILSYGEILSDDEALSEYDGLAAAVSGIASRLKGTKIKNVIWNIAGVTEQNAENVKRYLYIKLESAPVVTVKINTDCSINGLISMLRRCHVCLLPQSKMDYGFFGLESIAVGVPTFLNGKSQLGYYINDSFSENGNHSMVHGVEDWVRKIMTAVEGTHGAYQHAKKLKDQFIESQEVAKSYEKVAALFSEESTPSEDLDVNIVLNVKMRKRHRQKLGDQSSLLSRQHPDDDSSIAPIKKSRQDKDDAVQRCVKLFEENVRKVANGDSKEFSISIQWEQFGVNHVNSVHASSLGMAVNFLAMLYLYRFKSACHNGRFAKAFEPLLITDEMRELAERFNISLKLKATYDQQQFDAIDHYFCQRDGLHKLDDQFPQQGVHRKMPAEGDDIHGRLGQMTQFEMAKKESVSRASDIDILTKDSFVEECGEPGDQKRNFEDAELEASGIPDITGTKLLALKSDKDHRFLPSAEMYLPTIFNVDNYTALRGDQWDFIQFMVKMTEKIQHILSTRQEILSVLGVREFFVTDTDCETHDLYGLADQFLKHGRAPLYIKSSAKPYSLSVRSLIPYKVSHTLVDQKGQRSLELDLTNRNEALKFVLKYREEEITKLMGNLSTVENRVRQLESENTAQNQAVQEKKNLELQLKHAKQEVEIVQGLLKTETEKLKRAETACTKSALDSRQIQDKLFTAMQEKSNLEQQLENVQDMNKIQQTELVRADEKLASQLVRIKELESKGKQSEIPRVDKSTCTPSLPEKILEQISEVISIEEISSSVEPKPIGGTDYIGEKLLLKHRHGGSEWTLQLLGSEESGTEPGQFNYPKGLAWHGDQLVICDRDNHRIQILNKNMLVIEIIRFDGQFDKEFKPWDVAISPDGHFFITDIGNNQIIICDQNKQIIQIIPQSADIEVRSIAVMAAFIFVTDRKGNSLIKYNIKDGKLVARVSDRFSFPHSVMATSNNHLLVSDYNKHVIHVLDSDLNFLNSYHNDRLKYPQGLDVDSHGNIYICKRHSRGIVKLRSDGQLDCVLFEDVVYYPEFIAVNDDITTTIAVTGWRYESIHQIRVYSVST